MTLQNPQMEGKTPTPQDIKKETDLIKAQTHLTKAKADDIAAQRALAKAQREPDPDGRGVELASTKLNDLKKQKDLADAKKDLANSQTDALKAQVFGTVTGVHLAARSI